MTLHERRFFRILLGEAKREFGDEAKGNAEPNEEWPVPVEFSLQKHPPRLVPRHRNLRCSNLLPQLLLPCKP
ncbi:hypothetical protein SUGI_0230710 [Cryptomeria japonica]|nr:hypothetical protein SUGI_0230710 [Cryptomeria japonica]